MGLDVFSGQNGRKGGFCSFWRHVGWWAVVALSVAALPGSVVLAVPCTPLASVLTNIAPVVSVVFWFEERSEKNTQGRSPIFRPF